MSKTDRDGYREMNEHKVQEEDNGNVSWGTQQTEEQKSDNIWVHV